MFAVCACCCCVTLCVLQVQHSSYLGQWHQCNVFERGRRSGLSQRTLKRIDHFVSLPCNLQTHTHTQNETATLGVNVKKDNFLKTSCTCISVCVSPCNPELSVGAFCSVCGESCYRLLGNKSMRPS